MRTLLVLALLAATPMAQSVAHRKISHTSGGFAGGLDDNDAFGFSVAALGDLDGDGFGDVAVGAREDDDGGMDRGAVWVLFLGADRRVRDERKISSVSGGFTGALDTRDHFGQSLALLGDLGGDGKPELAVGAWLDDDGGMDRGAVWILSLNADGTVAAQAKISDTQGGFTGALDDGDGFAVPLAALGDLDGDGIGDLAVGAYLDDDGGVDRGAVWILFLNADGSVRAHQKISALAGGFAGALDDGDGFGTRLANLGDVDGDGTTDLAVGAFSDDDGGDARGAVWVLFLNADGTVRAHQKISATQGGFAGALDDGDAFGLGMASPGDLDGDGVSELLVGATRDDDGGVDRGAVWLLHLAPTGQVLTHFKISDTAGSFTGGLDDSDSFGIGVAALGDVDLDGVTDLAVGAWLDDDGGAQRGAVWVLSLCAGGASAQVTPRVGSPPNASALVAAGLPVWGTTWSPRIDHTTFHPTAHFDVLLVSAAPLQVPTSFGTLLVAIPPPAGILVGPAGAPFAIPIPSDCSVIGLPRHLQAGSIAPAADIHLTNALDIVVGTD